MDYINCTAKTSDGLNLRGWLVKSTGQGDDDDWKTKPMVVFFHENAGSKYVYF